jgi:hypothetical protein
LQEARERLATLSASSSGAAGIAAMVEEAEDDVLAFCAFPAQHWPKLARPTRWKG